MNPIYVLLAAVLGFVILRLLAGIFFRQVGTTALAKQPDAIHLQRVEKHAWRNAPALAALEDPLLVKGFVATGTYLVPEMPAIALRLLAKTAEASYACLYEHEKAGLWVEIFSRYQDGTGITYTIMPPRGLNPRPGHPVVHFPGLGAAELYARFAAERPGGALEHYRLEELASYFERSYAENMAWRKQEGISAQEVARIAATRKSAAR